MPPCAPRGEDLLKLRTMREAKIAADFPKVASQAQPFISAVLASFCIASWLLHQALPYREPTRTVAIPNIAPGPS